MKPLFVWTISIGVLAAAAGLKWAATVQQQKGPIFIADLKSRRIAGSG